MEKQGKFILMSLPEFENYIHDLNIISIRKINHIQQHHTLIPDYGNFNGSNHFPRLKSMEGAHIARGFKEIGQHYTTFPDGKIAVCRSLSLIPACIQGHNTGGICIENLGDFDKGKDVMNDIHKKTIIQLTGLLCFKFNLSVSSDHVVYHHWFKQSNGFRDNANNKHDLADHKTCPGTSFFGGNTVSEAEAHFLPEVLKAYNLYKSIAVPKKETILKNT